MNKKKIILIVMILMVCAGGYLVYINFKSPTTFFSDKELIEEINRYDHTHKAQKIVDKIEVDERHYYVPIQFSNGESGMSFWKWQMGNWQLIHFSNKKLLFWQLDEHDGTTRYILWHHHRLNMQDEKISMYLIRERNANMFNDDEHEEHRYDPKIQLEHQLQLDSYGMEPLPKAWGSIIQNVEQQNEKYNFINGFSMFDTFYQNQFTIRVQVDDFISFSPENGYGYWTGNADSTIEHPLYIEDIELE